MSVHRVARPLPTLALFGVAVLLATLAVVQAIEAGTRPRLLADALTLDLILTVPLAYWFLAVRGAGWPRLSVLPVFVLCVVTTRIVPGLETGRLLPRIEWIAIPAELLLLTILARRAVAMSRALRRSAGGDALESLRRAAFEMVRAERAAEVIAYEAAVLWYAVAGGGSRETDLHAEAFGVRRRSGYAPVLAALLLALTVEATALHLLVRHWSGAAAWVLTILTVYAVVWLIGDFRALGRRPILLTDDELVVRLGLRWTVRVPLARIRAVRGTGSSNPQGPDHLRAVLLGAERQVVVLDSEEVATGFYGLRRRVRSIGLSVDEPERFLRCLERRIGEPGN